jgi:hypothetical protein
MLAVLPSLSLSLQCYQEAQLNFVLETCTSLERRDQWPRLSQVQSLLSMRALHLYSLGKCISQILEMLAYSLWIKSMSIIKGGMPKLLHRPGSPSRSSEVVDAVE